MIMVHGFMEMYGKIIHPQRQSYCTYTQKSWSQDQTPKTQSRSGSCCGVFLRPYL